MVSVISDVLKFIIYIEKHYHRLWCKKIIIYIISDEEIHIVLEYLVVKAGVGNGQRQC